MLPTEIHAPEQLLSAAIAVERGAIKHYSDMADRMRHYGNTESVALFERLAAESKERKQKIIELAKLENIKPIEKIEPMVWEDPLMPKTYDAEARDPYRSTPYKALAYAAHNTDRAFNLYTHIAAIAEDPQVERYAQILASDALNRSRLLQSRRRRAYHTEQRGPWQKQLDAALKLTTTGKFYAVAAGIEQRLTGLLVTMEIHYDDLTPITEHSRQKMEHCSQRLDAGRSPIAVPEPPYNMEKIGRSLHHDVLLLFTESERAFNFYDTVMAHAFDEDIMLAAQDLSESALIRLEAIRKMQRRHDIEPAA